jgi:hypothetical protein
MDIFAYKKFLTTEKPPEQPSILISGERYYIKGDIELSDLLEELSELRQGVYRPDGSCPSCGQCEDEDEEEEEAE